MNEQQTKKKNNELNANKYNRERELKRDLHTVNVVVFGQFCELSLNFFIPTILLATVPSSKALNSLSV